MPSNRKKTLTVRILLVLAVLLVGLAAGLYFFLPHYLESRVIPQLLAETGFSNFAFKVRHLGIYGTELGALRIGSEKKPALIVRSVHIDYSPQKLFQKQIKRITLSGIELYGEFKDGKFSLGSVDFDQILTKLQSNRTSMPESGRNTAPIFLGKLEIRSAVIIITTDDGTHRFPFDIIVAPGKEDYSHLNLTASLYPRGESVRATARINLENQHIAANVSAVSLDLNRFSDLVQTLSDTISDSVISGKLDLEVTANLQLAPFKVSSLVAAAELQKCNFIFNNLRLQNVRNADQKEIPFRINLSKIAADDWTVSASAISATSPLPFMLSEWQGRIRPNGQQVESTGEFKFVLLPSSDPRNNLLPFEVLASLPLHGGYTAEYRKDQSIEINVTSTPIQPSGDPAARFKFSQYDITTGMPAVNISGRGKLENLSTAYTIRIPRVKVTSQAKSIHLPQILLEGTADFVNDGNVFPKAAFKLQSQNNRMLLSPARLSIADLIVSGKVKPMINGAIELEGLLQFNGAGGSVPVTGIKISGARGRIPLNWPPERQVKQGDISIAALYHKKLNVGKIRGKIHQTPAGFSFQGRHINRLLPEMSLNFSGDAKLLDTKDPVTKVNFNLLRPDQAAEIDLGKFLPGSEGVKANGKLMLTGDLAVDSSGLKGAIDLQVQNASLRIKKDKFAVEGIQLSLSIPELPGIRSAAGQHLVFSKIELGDLVANDGRIDFQIESPRTFLIEKMHFIWCEGKVETQSIRISPAEQNYLITFYCDRLKLAQVLGQFGAATAKGEGTVSGRIPLHYTNGKIRFDDGFLFSTPGQGGKIYLKGTDILTAGMTPNTPQYAQMELAREALKDYDYSWAKLNITSEGEDLLLQMQMDGKPARTLPFVYQKDIGGFVKVEAGSKGSKFQGIRLDVNFRLPLDKMLQYKELIKMIQ
ncbi:MAG: YdbH domain-containing protein [Desulfobacterales bacterium]|jgi:hypothetical protein